MSIKRRVEKLEQRFNKNGTLWAVFTIQYNENADNFEKAKTTLLKNYLSKGQPMPTHVVFVQNAGNEQEGFYTSFLLD